MTVSLKKQHKLTNKEKVQNVQTTIASRELSSIWVGEYQDFLTLQMKPITKTFIDKLGYDLLMWCKDHPDAIRFDDFFIDQGIARSTWYSWVAKFPCFRERLEETKRMIGRRRERGSYFKSGDLHESTRSSLGQFLDEYKKDAQDTLQMKAEIEKDLYEMKAKIDAQHDLKSGSGATIVVSMVPALDTGKVKPKKTKEERND